MQTGTPADPHDEPPAMEAASERESPRQNAQRRAVFFRLVEQLSATGSQIEAARLIAGATDELFHWDAFKLNTYQPSGDIFESVLSIDLIDGVRTEVPPPNSERRPGPLARQVITEGGKLFLRGSDTPEPVGTVPFGDKSRRSLSLMFVPIRRAGQVLGILSVQSYRPRAYEPADLDLLQATADLCAGALARLRAETAAKENEARLAMAQSIAHVGSYEFNPATGERHWSEETYRIWRRDPALGPVPPEEVLAMVVPEDRDRIATATRGTMAEGAPFDEEYRIRWPDGSVRHLYSRARVDRDGEGRPCKIIGTVQDVTERKQSERALRLFRAQVDGANDALEVLDPATGRFLDMNERGCLDLGRTREEILSLTVADIDPNINLEVFRARLQQLKEGGSIQVESVHQRKDGSTFPVEVTARLVRLDRDYLVAVIRDITERKRADDALTASQERFRAFMDHSPAVAWMKDEQGRHVYLNQTYERRFGVRLADWAGKTDLELWPPEVAQEFRRNDQRVLELGQTLELTEETVSPDGTRTLWSNFKFLVRDPAGNRYVGGIGVDVTERKRIEAALHLQAAVLQNMSDAMLLIDPRNIFIDCNPAAEHLLGFSRSALIGQPSSILFKPADQYTFASAFRAAARADAPWRGEVVFARSDGSEVICESVCVPLRDASGKVTATITVSRDMTEQVALKRQILETTDRERERIGQDLHDGLCQHLVGTAYAANQFARDLDRRGDPSVVTAREIAELLDESINMARQIARGLYPASLQTSGLATALHEHAALMTRRSKLHWQVEADESLPIKEPALAMHLFRIAQEAANNAVKHACASRITIHLSRLDETLRLSVTDDGVGMPDTPTGKPGLGLQILRYRAAAIGGRLEIASAPNEGTTVTCLAPFKPAR